MAVPRGRADQREIYRALVVDEYSDTSWSEYLRAGSRADNGRSPTTGPTLTTDGGQLVEPELPTLHVGDHVTDRERDDDAPLIVVGRPPETVAEYEVDGEPLTEYNPEHPGDDDVVEAVYAKRTDIEVSDQTYAFPRSRLRLAAAIHDRDEDESEVE